MNYTLSRNGTTLGAFSENELREGVGAGRFIAQDLAWREGMEQWQSLAAVLKLPGSAVPPPLPVNQASPFPAPPPVAPKAIGDDAGMRLLLPVGRSGWAIAAGYLGLFCLIVLPAPIAVVVSIIAIRDIQKSKKEGQKQKHGMGRAVFGLVAGTLTILGVLYAIVTMSLSR